MVFIGPRVYQVDYVHRGPVLFKGSSCSVAVAVNCASNCYLVADREAGRRAAASGPGDVI